MCNLTGRIYVVNSLAVAFRKGVVESFVVGQFWEQS